MLGKEEKWPKWLFHDRTCSDFWVVIFAKVVTLCLSLRLTQVTIPQIWPMVQCDHELMKILCGAIDWFDPIACSLLNGIRSTLIWVAAKTTLHCQIQKHPLLLIGMHRQQSKIVEFQRRKPCNSCACACTVLIWGYDNDAQESNIAFSFAHSGPL